MKLRVKIENETFEVDVKDLAARPIVAEVDGERFEIYPEEAVAPGSIEPACAPDAVTFPPSAAPAANVDRNKSVLAPIPGVIIAIAVKPGDSVIRGQELCTLEAMKMKNAIRATRDGKIATVLVNVGDQVKHSQVLIEFAD
jgi:biotin carboxyl carrier protein